MLLLPIIYKKWENYRKEKKEQIYFVDSDVYPYGTFKHNLTWNGTMVYEPKPDYSKEEYIYAAENMIWIDNPSERNLRVNKGVLNIHSVSEIKEKNVKLRMIVGTKENKLIVYVVNNTNTDFGYRYFRFSPHLYYETYPQLSDEEMKKVFNTEEFEKRIERIPSGGIFKVFEFELSEYSRHKLEDNLEMGSYLFLIEHYENELTRRDGIEHIRNNAFNPIYLYYENDQLNYGYSFQGGSEEQPESENSIPIVYIDVKNQHYKKYSVNINSKIKSKETTCLVQYIVPSHSCKIEYSIDIKINNESIRDEKKKIEIEVPIYRLGEGLRIRNEKAFALLERNSIEKLFVSEHNEFVNQFKYNSEEWKKDQIVETSMYDKVR